MVILSAVFIAFHAELFFALAGERPWAERAGEGCGAALSGSLERPSENSDLKARVADMAVCACGVGMSRCI